MPGRPGFVRGVSAGGLVLQRKTLFCLFFSPYSAEEKKKIKDFLPRFHRISTPALDLKTLLRESVFVVSICGSDSP